MTPPPSFSEEQLSDRLVQAMIHTLELFGVYLGKRLGRYRMPAEHVGVLVDPEHAAHLAPFAEMAAGIGGALEHVVEAYRSGAGVPYEAYGAVFVSGQGGINRPAFMQDLTGAWLPAVPDLHRRLAADPPARIADVGCGVGWSTLALARAYPRATVVGYDMDAASVAEARRRAAAESLAVRFEQKGAEAVAMAEQPSEAIGTAIRPDTVRRCAREAGFGRCEVLEIASPLFRFYRLRA